MTDTPNKRAKRTMDMEDPKTWGTKANWVFTINNYTEQDLVDIPLWDTKYHHFGKEVAPSTGTPHLQGYAVFKAPVRLAALKKIHPRAKWMPAVGTCEQNIEYCSKEGDFFSFGTPPINRTAAGAAEKKRWANAVAAAKEGRMDDIPADIFLRYYRTCKEIKKDYMVKPDDTDGVTGVWYWGPPETGKSRAARADFPNFYTKMQNKWWDGYQGEDNVILDDFDCKELGHHLKIWADRYSFTAETKGGAIAIRPKKFIVTSNYAPEDGRFGWDTDMVAAIRRRFTVVHFPKKIQRTMSAS